MGLWGACEGEGCRPRMVGPSSASHWARSAAAGVGGSWDGFCKSQEKESL